MLLVASVPVVGSGMTQSISPDRHLTQTTLFHSAGHPDARVAEIGELRGAVYLAADHFVFLDASSQLLVFVDVSTGAVASAGGKGDGPQEFRSAGLLSRSGDGGVTVWDSQQDRISVAHVVNGRGDVSAAPGYDRSLLMGDLGTRPVARYRDGTVVIRTNAMPSRDQFQLVDREPGVFRDEHQYWLVVPGRERRLMFDAMSSERYSATSATGSRATTSLIFGHLLIHAQVGQHLAVAQTDLGTVRVFDDAGNVTSEIPLPPGVPVSDERIEAERNRLLTDNDAMSKRISQGSTGDFDFGGLWRRRGEFIRAVPANRVAPPIDHMVGDLGGRLWLRQVRPDDDREHWQVWDPLGPNLMFTLTLSDGEQILDAAGDRVLLRTTDEFDVEYLLVKEIAKQGQGCASYE